MLGVPFVPPFAQGVQCDGGMGEGAACAHLGANLDGFHGLLVGCASPVDELGVTGDAVRALGDVRDRHRDQLLGLARQGAVAKTRRLNASNASWIAGASSRRKAPISAVPGG